MMAQAARWRDPNPCESVTAEVRAFQQLEARRTDLQVCPQSLAGAARLDRQGQGRSYSATAKSTVVW